MSAEESLTEIERERLRWLIEHVLHIAPEDDAEATP